ncbi:glycosyltransferase family 39 protein [Amycolatopsis tolypomycina]|uniref:glycosyltransferase family 39 protein n=1 Tax=Amycolatopsis tolypomycina TaxID=208445 RepID=UPI0033B31B44
MAALASTRLLSPVTRLLELAPTGTRSNAARLTAAASAYLLVRVVGVLVLAALAGAHDSTLLDRLTAWDGRWYLNIAELGYAAPGGDVNGDPYPDAAMAFFPLYPGFIATLGQLGLPLPAAGLLLSAVAGVAASLALYRIGDTLGGHRAGLVLVVLWAGAPLAITQSMVMTEALFTAYAAWALVGVLERQWALAAICCAFAGLTRSTAVVLVAVVVAAALAAVWRSHGRGRWRPLVCAAVAPLGLGGFWGAVAARTGSLTGWQDIELKGWGVRYDGGVETAEYVWHVLTRDAGVFQTVVVGLLIGAAALAVLGVRRLPWQLTAYGAGVVVLVLGTAGIPATKPRFLIPAFVLLLPVALGLARRRPSTSVAVCTSWVLVGSWLSAYSLTVWKYAI